MAIVCAIFVAGRFVTEGDSMGESIKQDVCKQWVERDKKGDCAMPAPVIFSTGG